MSLKSMAFAHLAPTEDAAFALADIWFGELSGSLESGIAQRAARRQLAFLIRARMEGPPDTRTMADVIHDACRANKAGDGTCSGGIGLQMILLNVTESRTAMYAEEWRRRAEGLP